MNFLPQFFKQIGLRTLKHLPFKRTANQKCVQLHSLFPTK